MADTETVSATNNSVGRLITEQQLASFKVPSSTVLPPRKKKTVLKEDEYVQRLDQIIQRDFFPDLTKLQVQAAYLDAMATNDIPKLRAIYEKYSVGPSLPSERGNASPATFETPIRDPDLESERGGLARSTTASSVGSEKKESLDEFLNRHTSEDNESFEEIMDEAQRRHRMKNAWLFETEEKSKRNQEASLALPSIEKQALEDAKPSQVETWTYKAKNCIMYYPEGAPLTTEEKVKLALDKEHIDHSSTRYQGNPFDEARNRETVREAARQQSKAQSLGRVDAQGQEVRGPQPGGVNGFSFMKTPSPAPGVGDSPLMTWGEIEGTPFRLDGSDTPLPSSALAGPAFHLQDVPERDRIGLKLAEKVGQGYRDRRHRSRTAASPYVAHGTPLGGGHTPATVRQRMASMSPAARRLASSRLGIRLGTDSALQASYTPQRSSGSDRTPTPRRFDGAATPSTPGARRPTPARGGGSLTDNLLQLPKRSRAQDFF